MEEVYRLAQPEISSLHLLSHGCCSNIQLPAGKMSSLIFIFDIQSFSFVCFLCVSEFMPFVLLIALENRKLLILVRYLTYFKCVYYFIYCFLICHCLLIVFVVVIVGRYFCCFQLQESSSASNLLSSWYLLTRIASPGLFYLNLINCSCLLLIVLTCHLNYHNKTWELISSTLLYCI